MICYGACLVVKNVSIRSSEEEPKVVRKYDDAPSIEEWVSDDEEENVSQPKTEKKIVRPSIIKKEFVKSKQQEKTTRKTVKQVEQHRQNTHSPRGNQRNWNNMMSQKLGSNFKMFNKACYVCGSFDHLQDQGVIDSGCSRNMTRNMSYLTDYEEIDGGYVAFGGNPKGGKIIGKGDETSGILKSFINGIENLVDHKVKVKLGRKEERTCQRITFCSIMDWFDPLITQDPKSSHDDGSKPLSDDGKKVDEDPRKDSKCKDLEKEYNVNRTNNVNTISSTVNAAGTNKVNTIGGKISIELPFDPNMPSLEDDSIFDFSRDDEDDGVVANMNNLDTTIQVSPNLTTRIHKDHPFDQVDWRFAIAYKKKDVKEFGGT
ncbi:hypothetical protein Tco_1254404 [Tanacetum coccineum]